jgi:hypothetical protein
LPGFPGIRADVRGEDYVVLRTQGTAIGFLAEHIKASTPYPALVQARTQGCFIDELSPGSVY